MRRISFLDQAELTRLWFIWGRGPKADPFWGRPAPGSAGDEALAGERDPIGRIVQERLKRELERMEWMPEPISGISAKKW